jgi:hypothetical protein
MGVYTPFEEVVPGKIIKSASAVDNERRIYSTPGSNYK